MSLSSESPLPSGTAGDAAASPLPPQSQGQSQDTSPQPDFSLEPPPPWKKSAQLISAAASSRRTDPWTITRQRGAEQAVRVPDADGEKSPLTRLRERVLRDPAAQLPESASLGRGPPERQQQASTSGGTAVQEPPAQHSARAFSAPRGAATTGIPGVPPENDRTRRTTRTASSTSNNENARILVDNLRHALRESERERGILKRQYADLGQKISQLAERYEEDVGSYKSKCAQLRQKCRTLVQKQEQQQEQAEARTRVHVEEIAETKRKMLREVEQKEGEGLRKLQAREQERERELEKIIEAHREKSGSMLQKLNAAELEVSVLKEKVETGHQLTLDQKQRCAHLEHENGVVTARLKQSWGLLEKLRNVLEVERRRHAQVVEEKNREIRFESQKLADAQHANHEKVLLQNKMHHDKHLKTTESIVDDLRKENHDLRVAITEKEENCFKANHSLDRATFLLDQNRQLVQRLEEKLEVATGGFTRKKREQLLEKSTEICRQLMTELASTKAEIRSAERFFSEQLEKALRKMLKLETAGELLTKKSREYDKLLALHRKTNVCLLKTGEELLKTRYHVQVSTRFVGSLLDHFLEGTFKPMLLKEVESLFAVATNVGGYTVEATAEKVREKMGERYGLELMVAAGGGNAGSEPSLEQNFGGNKIAPRGKGRTATRTSSKVRTKRVGAIRSPGGERLIPVTEWESCRAPVDSYWLPYLICAEKQHGQNDGEAEASDDDADLLAENLYDESDAKNQAYFSSSEQEKELLLKKKSALYEVAKKELKRLFAELDEMRRQLKAELCEIGELDGYYDLISQWSTIMNDTTMKETLAKAAQMATFGGSVVGNSGGGLPLPTTGGVGSVNGGTNNPSTTQLDADPALLITERHSQTEKGFLELAKILLAKLQKRASYATRKVRNEVFDAELTPGVPPKRALLLLEHALVSEAGDLKYRPSMYEFRSVPDKDLPEVSRENASDVVHAGGSGRAGTGGQHLASVPAAARPSPWLFYPEDERQEAANVEQRNGGSTKIDDDDDEAQQHHPATGAAFRAIDGYVGGREMGVARALAKEELPLLDEEVADTEEVCFVHSGLLRGYSLFDVGTATSSSGGGAAPADQDRACKIARRRATFGSLLKAAVDVVVQLRTDLLSLQWDAAVSRPQQELLRKKGKQLGLLRAHVGNLEKKMAEKEKYLGAEAVADEIERLRKSALEYERQLGKAETEKEELRERVRKRDAMLERAIVEQRREDTSVRGSLAEAASAKVYSEAVGGAAADRLAAAASYLYYPSGASMTERPAGGARPESEVGAGFLAGEAQAAFEPGASLRRSSEDFVFTSSAVSVPDQHASSFLSARSFGLEESRVGVSQAKSKEDDGEEDGHLLTAEGESKIDVEALLREVGAVIDHQTGVLTDSVL